MVDIWVPLYLPVIVSSSLISIFTELFVTSSTRLSVTLHLTVKLCRAEAGIELRHMDRVKGNFAVFDNKVYLATAIVKESQPIPQVVYSNVSTIVEQQQYLFETLWDKAVPAEEKIREIEEGIPTERTEVLHKEFVIDFIHWVT